MAADGRVAHLRAECLARLSFVADMPAPHVLVGYPDHDNCGDHGIWAGTVRLLEHHLGLRVHRFVEPRPHPAALRALLGGEGRGTVLMHGGGSFGDVWPEELAWRQAVLSGMPDTPIVQLPQSIEFAGETALAATADLIAGRRAPTVIVARDRHSEELAKAKLAAHVRLAPDPAFLLDDLNRRAPDRDILCLLRRDKEAPMPEPGGDRDRATDWGDLARPPAVRRARRWRRNMPTALRRSAWGARRLGRLFDDASAAWVDAATALLSRGRVVVTDRLHGHILCLVMGIPHVFVDNSYGKIGRFADSWNTRGKLARQAGSLAEAEVIAHDLVRGSV